MIRFNTCLLGTSFLSIVSSSFTDKGHEIEFLEKIEGKAPRNVIFILSDDHRYDYLGFLGTIPWLETPHMDNMFAEGAYFSNAYVTTSLSSPSRATILTGQYSHVHNVVDNYSAVPDNLIWFPQYLQKAGYQTSFIGKWHMGDAEFVDRDVESDDPQPGFDHWVSFPGQGVYYDQTLNINGTRISYTDSTYITDQLTELAIEWLEERDREKPFFLYLSHKAVHADFSPAKRHEGYYAGKNIPLPPTYDQTKTGEWRELGWPEWVKKQRVSWHGVDYMYNTNDSFQDLVRRYCEALLALDESVGTVIEYLKREGLDESTLVVYMGDNGFAWGEKGLIDKRHFYEESGKVPFLVRIPEIMEGGQTIPQLVQNIDIAPTILEWAGLAKPEYMPGKSFIQLLEGDDSDWRDMVFYEYFWEYDFPMTPTTFGVRSDRYKYIRYHGLWDTNEFYDLENDPHEMYNLIGDPDLQHIIRQHAEALYNWLESTDGMQIPLIPTIYYRASDYKNPNQY